MTIGRDDAAHLLPRRFGLRIRSWRWVPVEALRRIHHCGNQVAWAAAAVSAFLFLYSVIYAFPNARRVALQQEREVVAQENRAFCEKHGITFGTRQHTVCAEDLMDIRANERRRTLDELGIF